MQALKKDKEKPIIALIYDFDGTLSPGNMQEFGFIEAMGKSPEAFWNKSNDLAISQDASEILCYMKMMIDEAKANNVALRRESFQEFGKRIPLYDGVKEWFSLINEYGKARGIKIIHYINSSGLVEMIEGTPIYKEFEKVFACSFLYDELGLAVWPAVAVDYTAKTQFLFKINKGVHSIRDHTLVNRFVPENKRHVPFTRMIYFGDGATDIPCMRLVKEFKGNSIAVYNPKLLPEGNFKAINAVQRLLEEGRVNFVSPADYSKDGKIYNIVTSIINKIKADLDLEAIPKL